MHASWPTCWRGTISFVWAHMSGLRAACEVWQQVTCVWLRGMWNRSVGFCVTKKDVLGFPSLVSLCGVLYAWLGAVICSIVCVWDYGYGLWTDWIDAAAPATELVLRVQRTKFPSQTNICITIKKLCEMSQNVVLVDTFIISISGFKVFFMLLLQSDLSHSLMVLIYSPCDLKLDDVLKLCAHVIIWWTN